MVKGQKSNKTRSKLENLLRQDHSDVYFDNERLNDELNNKIESMQKEMHRNDLVRAIEIGKIRKEISGLRAVCAATSAENQLREISIRPQTAGNNPHRKATSGQQRAKSAWARTDIREKAKQEVPEEPEPEVRSESAISTVSTLKDTKTLRRYKKVKSQHFKENKRFPEEWYLRCLPASDAAIYNARKKVRGKSAPPHFDFLAKLREKDLSERKLFSSDFKSNAKLTEKRNNRDDMTEASGGDRMSLICEEQVKPVLMSRRRLKEMSNVETLGDRGPSRNTQRKQDIKAQNAVERQRIDGRVREFCVEIEELKSREKRAIKEREDAIKREAQEQMYLQDMEKLEENEEEKKDAEDSRMAMMYY